MRNKNSKNKKALIRAYEKGYRIIDGVITYKNRNPKGWITKQGYRAFSVRTYKGSKTYRVMVHRLVALQKYGNKIFKKGIEVRHQNNNPLDNSESNILIGTHKQNCNDKPVDVRMRVAINASSFAKKHDHEKIMSLHDSGLSYTKIMEVTGITSKGTVSFIIKQSMNARIKDADFLKANSPT